MCKSIGFVDLKQTVSQGYDRNESQYRTAGKKNMRFLEHDRIGKILHNIVIMKKEPHHVKMTTRGDLLNRHPVKSPPVNVRSVFFSSYGS